MRTIEENKYYKIICNLSFEDIKEELIKFLNIKINEIMLFFNITNIEPISIYLYDQKEKFQEDSKIPYTIKYLAGVFNPFGVKVYGDLNNITKEKFFTCITHEITHLIYQNYIQEKGIKNRVVWFDEGLAANLSGEHQNLLNDDNLNSYLIKHIYSEGKIIPDIKYLQKHGNKFGTFVDTETNKYNGYSWSYLMLRYLLEQKSKEEMDIIMRNKKEIEIIGEKLPEVTHNYFKKKIKTK